MPTTFKSTLLPFKLITTTISPLVAMVLAVLAEAMLTATIMVTTITTTAAAAVVNSQPNRAHRTRFTPVRLLPI
jgi:hypothetical protein